MQTRGAGGKSALNLEGWRYIDRRSRAEALLEKICSQSDLNKAIRRTSCLSPTVASRSVPAA